ncbi:MAG TPA: class I tRNA ligase family protein, partial [Coxiellaceae bacterium]|nr:class I tRNA ligase family protein [Coxiellaceae bacterium]
LKKLWSYAMEVAEALKTVEAKVQNLQLDTEQKKFRQEVHTLLKQISLDMERKQLNTVISSSMKLFNSLSKLDLQKENNSACSLEALKILLLVLSPVAPHLCHVLWQRLDYGDNILTASWPKIDPAALECDEVEYIIQINGKLRSRINLSKSKTAAEVEEAVRLDPNVLRHTEGKMIRKLIVVPNKLVNIVV